MSSRGSRPETLRYSDLRSESTRSDSKHRTSTPKLRDGLSVERSSLDRLKHGNDFLYRENVLLKEQLLLRQENMRMHGVNILSEVIQLLNEQDLHDEAALAQEPGGSSRFHDDDCDDETRVSRFNSQRVRKSRSLEDEGPARRSYSKEVHFDKPEYHSTAHSWKLNRNSSEHHKTSCSSSESDRGDGEEEYSGTHYENIDLPKFATRESRAQLREEYRKNHYKLCEHRHLHVQPRKKSATGKTKSALSITKSGNTTYPNIATAYRPQTAVEKTTKKGDSAPRSKSKSRRHGTPSVWVQRNHRNSSPSLQKSDDSVQKWSLLESNSHRVLGEIAFQLDKRILSFVLNGKYNNNGKYRSFYGYNVANLRQRIMEKKESEAEILLNRYESLVAHLSTMGYRMPYHSDLTAAIVNRYGVMRQSTADVKEIAITIADETKLRKTIRQLGEKEEVNDLLTLLQCLTVMAADDGLPLFVW